MMVWCSTNQKKYANAVLESKNTLLLFWCYNKKGRFPRGEQQWCGKEEWVLQNIALQEDGDKRQLQL